eukprot:657265-Pelagomonas_calceolata.AAC.1
MKGKIPTGSLGGRTPPTPPIRPSSASTQLPAHYVHKVCVCVTFIRCLWCAISQMSAHFDHKVGVVRQHTALHKARSLRL